jgi:tRNA/rRNA methyltransferase
VLVEPREPGNIGATARAMANMGLTRMFLVRPVEHLVPEAFKMALGGRRVLEEAAVFDDLPRALEGFSFVAGTSRRGGADRKSRVSPRSLAAEIAGLGSRNRAAVMFGRENHGLTNRELKLCHRLVTIPSDPEHSSLNLSQSVLLLAYELYLVGGMKKRSGISPPTPELAPFERVEELYLHMERVLLEIGYLQPDNPERMMRTFRRLFGRVGLEECDVRALRGIFRQVEWYGRSRGSSRT